MKQLFNSMLVVLALCLASPSTLLADAMTEKTHATAKKDKKNQRTIALWGHVKDSFTKVGVKGVKITLMREDSTVVDTTTVFVTGNNSLKNDYAYKFDIPTEPCRFIILAQHPDYEDSWVNFHIRSIARNKYFDAPWHYMKRRTSVTSAYDGETLREVTVKGTQVKIAYRGDTLVYDAAAFKLPDGSMLDALVRQLPGAELKDDGTITVNGRKVDYLTLNGKDFFKGNNKIMLDNLPYFTVQNIKVYDRTTDKSRYMGRDVEMREYVMDVNLKKQYRTGYIGNVEVGGASSDRYLGRLFASSFSDHTKVSLFANVNNINETRNPESNGDWSASNAPEGKTTNRSAGVNIYAEGKETMFKNTFNATAFWNDYANNTSNRQTQFLQSGNSYSLSDSHTDTRNRQLSVTNDFTLQLPVWLYSYTEVNIGDTRENGAERQATLSQSTDRYGEASQALDSVFATPQPTGIRESLLNQARNSELYRGHHFNAYQRFVFNKKLAWGDNLELELNAGYQQRENKSYVDYRLDYADPRQEADYRNIYVKSPTKGYHYEARGEYFFNFVNNFTLRLYTTYKQSLDHAVTDYYRLDSYDEWRDGLWPLGTVPSTADSLWAVRSAPNSMYQNKLTRNSQTGLNFHYNRRTDSTFTYMQIHLPMIVRNEKLNYQRATTDTCASRTRAFLDGEINLRFAWKRWKHWLSATIVHRTILPDMTSLVAFDFTNPLAVTLANADLKSGQKWTFDGRYQVRLFNNRLTISVTPQLGYLTNPILTGYSYDSSTGAYTYQPQNGDYCWNGELGLGLYGTIDKKQRFSYSISSKLGYELTQTMEMTGERAASQLADRHLTNYKTWWNFFYRSEKMTTGLTGSYTLHVFSFDDNSHSSYRTHDLNLTYSANGFIPVVKVFVGTTFGWYYTNTTLGNTPSQNNYVWNATISHSFLKGKRLTAKLSAYDLLNTVANYSYTVNPSSMNFRRTDRIGRYVMLSLSYKLNIMPGK